MKRKQFVKGISQLSEEGAIQVFRQADSGMEMLVVGAVGALQFEVLEHRLKHEYGVDLRIQHLPFKYARWPGDGLEDPKKLNLTSSTMIVTDRDGRTVFLFENDWSVRWAEERNKGLVLTDIAAAF